jgi:serine protease AprX
MIYEQDPDNIERAWSSVDPSYTQGDGVLPLPVRLRAHPYYRGRGVTICVLDSDFVLHPDLSPETRVLAYVDASGERIREGVRPAPPHDGSWHGTMTAVVAAGNGSASGGRFRGLAPEARLVLVRVSDRQGRIKERDIVRGLRWVLRQGPKYGVRVVNLSLGGDDALPSGLSEVDRAVEELVAQGVVVVAAAGNSGARSLTPPASAPGAITVGGLDDQGGLDLSARAMWHSNYGPTKDGVLKPDLIAPSLWVPAPIVPGTPVAEEAAFIEDIGRQEPEELPAFVREFAAQEEERAQRSGVAKKSLVPRELLQADAAAILAYGKNRRRELKLLSAHYQHADGTSFAAPAVSGVVAQMLEVSPALTPRQVKDILRKTAAPLPGVPREVQGLGVVQPGRAVLSVLRAARPDERLVSPRFEGERVLLSYRDPERRTERVEVACEWLNWRRLLLLEERPGVFSISLPRPAAGRYLYKFALDGERWREDPENSTRTPDGFGGWNSVLLVS